MPFSSPASSALLRRAPLWIVKKMRQIPSCDEAEGRIPMIRAPSLPRPPPPHHMLSERALGDNRRALPFGSHSKGSHVRESLPRLGRRRQGRHLPLDVGSARASASPNERLIDLRSPGPRRLPGCYKLVEIHLHASHTLRWSPRSWEQRGDLTGVSYHPSCKP